jgi:hypothetical protein
VSDSGAHNTPSRHINRPHTADGKFRVVYALDLKTQAGCHGEDASPRIELRLSIADTAGVISCAGIARLAAPRGFGLITRAATWSLRARVAAQVTTTRSRAQFGAVLLLDVSPSS